MTFDSFFLIGGPGIGKSMISKVLSTRFGFDHLSISKCVGEKENIDSTELFSDERVIDFVSNKLSTNTGFIIDGFPRTLAQANFLYQKIPNRRVAIISLLYSSNNRKYLWDSISTRSYCNNCGSYFQLPISIESTSCDNCLTGIVEHKDSSEKIFNLRLEEHLKSAELIKNVFSSFTSYYEVCVNPNDCKHTVDLFRKINFSLSTKHI